jgi:predicted nucleic acid-binding protein
MEQRMNFFDTNVLVASLITAHMHHPQSLARIEKMRRDGGACASHTLAEAFNTLTRLGGYALSPVAVNSMLQQVTREFRLISLTPEETLETIQRAAQQGLSGGIIFDCLLIACARKVQAAHIYTSNVKHFRKIAPDLAAIIQEP